MEPKHWVSADTVMVSEDPEYEEPKNYRSMTSMWPDWHKKAVCLGDSEEVFFGSSSPQTRPAYTLSEINKARAKCQTCPVFEACLRHALRAREQYGVWAGTTMSQRAQIFKLLDQKKFTEDEVVETVMKARTL